MVPADSGETAASLYRDYGEWLRKRVRRSVPGREIAHAEDIVQDTFVRVIRHLDKGKAIDSPRGFLHTTARNLIRSTFHRGRKHFDTDWIPDMDVYESPATVYSPEYLAIAREKFAALNVAVSTLPQRYQEAFIRRRIHGESCREIGMIMQLSENAVSNYAALGWKQLLEYCEEHDIVLNNLDDQV